MKPRRGDLEDSGRGHKLGTLQLVILLHLQCLGDLRLHGVRAHLVGCDERVPEGGKNERPGHAQRSERHEDAGLPAVTACDDMTAMEDVQLGARIASRPFDRQRPTRLRVLRQ